MRQALEVFVEDCEEIIDRVKNLSEHPSQLNLQKAEFLDAIRRDIRTIRGSAQLFGLDDLISITRSIESHIEKKTQEDEDIFSPDSINFLTEACAKISTLIEKKKATLSQKPSISLSKPHSKKAASKQPSHVQEAAPKAPNQADSWGLFDETPAAETEPPKKSALTSPASTYTIVPTAQTSSEENDSKKNLNQNSANLDQKHVDTLRVQVSILDKLMNQVGELVLVRNQFVQWAADQQDTELNSLSQRLNFITSELQNDVMKTRMQPIAHICNKFQRSVRQLGKQLGKKIHLTLEGLETELDKALMEEVKDPLTHIVNNAIDHGLESPEERLQSGKTETGNLKIFAYHEAGQVVVEVSDDGRGIDSEKVLSKAIKQGLIGAEEAESLPEADVLGLIMSPGFSTADKVTDVSGRGVGMDVVRTNIERIGGNIDISSKKGKGSVFKIKIPLTLAIVPALIVRSSQTSFAIHQSKILELVKTQRISEDGEGFEYLHNSPILRLRGELIPLIELSSILYEKESVDMSKDQDINIVIVDADGFTFGLIVEEIEDSIDIVVKPIHQALKNLLIYSGASLLGDGKVALTLDVNGIAQRSGLSLQEFVKPQQHMKPQHTDRSIEYLIVDLGDSSPYALPLFSVSRLEEFAKSRIQFNGRHRVLRYRNGVLPIVDPSENLHSTTDNRVESARSKDSLSDAKIMVVVVQSEFGLVGIETKSVIDVYKGISETTSKFLETECIKGTLIIKGKTIPIINPYSLIDRSISAQNNQNELGDAPTSKAIIIQKNPIVAGIIQDMLLKANITSVGFQNTRQWSQGWKEDQPVDYDVLILDSNDETQEESETIDKINSRQQARPIISLTSNNSSDHHSSSIRTQTRETLAKVDLAKITKVINRMLHVKEENL